MNKKITIDHMIEPSVIAGKWRQLESQIRHFISLGVRRFHLDVMDGMFVPNFTIGPDIVKAIRSIDKDILLDVHLMVYEPFNHIKAFADVGVDEITFHVEATENIEDTIKEILARGCKVGLAFKPDADIGAYLKYFRDKELPIHKALIMTVMPGFCGQKFMEKQLETIKVFAKFFADLKCETYIQVDGGINANTIKLAKAAGANLFVLGSYLYADQCSKTMTEGYNNLRKSLII